MSHFSVLVIGEDVEAALAPFQENNMGDCPDKYLEFHDITEEHRERYALESTLMLRGPDGQLHERFDEQFRDKSASPLANYATKYPIPTGYVEIDVPFKDLFDTFEGYMASYYPNELDAKTGKYGYWENPNCRWDWWTIGGRFADRLLLKEGVSTLDGLMVSQARIKDIDWEGLRTRQLQDAKEDWASYVAATMASAENVSRRQLAMYEFDVQQDESEDAYLARKTEFSCWAVIKEGVWYEHGEMGWFGVAHNQKEHEAWQLQLKNLLADLSPDTLLTIVDCHI